jgi:hypothetical protein
VDCCTSQRAERIVARHPGKFRSKRGDLLRGRIRHFRPYPCEISAAGTSTERERPSRMTVSVTVFPTPTSSSTLARSDMLCTGRPLAAVMTS